MKYLTLDIGGSSIKYAIMDEDIQIYEQSSIPTPLDTLEHLVESIGELYDKYRVDIHGIAISMPGVIDPENGYCYTGGSLTYIKNLNFVEVLQKRCPIKITIGNDAKCAANAEIGYGNLQGVQDGAVVILGTGIGGCLIKNHKVHTGRHFSAGEFSFMQTNCLEPYGWDYTWCRRNGIDGLLKRVQEKLGTQEHYTGIEIFEMAHSGNQQVIDAIDQFALEVATQIYNVHILFDCEKIAIGGGISAQEMLIQLIQKNFDDVMNSLGIGFYKPEIVPCYFRNNSNLVGALYQHIS